MACPSPYTNCADPSQHPEMCISGAQVSYSNAHPANKKCCPAGFSCGPAYDSPCENAVTHEVTPAKYISVEGVFAGCHDSTWLSPAAVGGIVAVGVLAFLALCFAALWCVRRTLYRPMGGGARRRTKSKPGKAGARDSVAERNRDGAVLELGTASSGITVTTEVKVEGEGRAEV